MKDAEVVSILKSVRPKASVVTFSNLQECKEAQKWHSTQEGVNTNSKAKIKHFLNKALPKDARVIGFVAKSGITGCANSVNYQFFLGTDVPTTLE